MFVGIAFGLFTFVIGASALAVFLFFRVRNLEQRLRRLEGQRSAEAPETARAPAAPEVAAGAVRTPPAAEGVAPRAEDQPAASRALDLEGMIAGRWLNRVGVLAVLLGTSFFLKFAFDNDWIGPSGRVAIGLLAGTGLLAVSEWFLRRDLRYFSEGITALGGGVLFLSLYAAWDFYRLIPQGAAFGGMIVITVALAGLARGRGSERLALLALLGGLATPGLLSTGVDSQATLFIYLLALAAGFLAFAAVRSWRSLAPVALAGVVLYFFAWFDQFYDAGKLPATVGFAALFFSLFAAAMARKARQDSPLRLDEICTVVANALWFGWAVQLMLYDEHRWWLTIAVLALAAVHVALARAAATAAGRYLFSGLALAFATAAIPIRLEGAWIPTALAVEGAALVWAGFRSGVRALRGVGLAVLAAAVLLLFDASGDPGRFLANTRFLAFVAVAAALGSSAIWAARHPGGLTPAEGRLFALAGGLANAVAVWGLSEETWRFLGRASIGLEPRLARQLGLSLLWTACGSLLIAAGVQRHAAPLRWQGLALIGLAVAKVFLFDLSFLERAYRIISFVVLGVVLLAVSFFYQRGASRAGRSGES